MRLVLFVDAESTVVAIEPGLKSRSGPIWLNNYRGSARAFASIVVRVLLAAAITEGYQGASKQNKAVVMF
jgi:hypothetical protein